MCCLEVLYHSCLATALDWLPETCPPFHNKSRFAFIASHETRAIGLTVCIASRRSNQSKLPLLGLALIHCGTHALEKSPDQLLGIESGVRTAATY